MQPETMSLNLEEFANGELSAKINQALKKVQENCLDLNTPFKNKRAISVKIGFTMDNIAKYLEFELAELSNVTVVA